MRAQSCELCDQAARDRRGEERVAGGDDAHRLEEGLGWNVLEEEPARARLEGVVDVLVEVEGREDEDARPVPVTTRADLPGRLDPVHSGIRTSMSTTSG